MLEEAAKEAQLSIMDSAASAMEDQVASAKVDLEDLVNDPMGTIDELPTDDREDSALADDIAEDEEEQVEEEE